MTSRKIERLIVEAFGEWTPACRTAAKGIVDKFDLSIIPDAALIQELLRPERTHAIMSALGKRNKGKTGGTRLGAGRPLSGVTRCKCGVMTAERAKARAHKC